MICRFLVIVRAGLWIESDSIEEETRVQNPGSLFWVGFLVSGLMQSWVGFWVSSSSQGLGF